MDKSGKYWGITRKIFYQNNVEMHYMEINPGGFCSEHKHTYKYNKFLVLEGSLEIRSWKSGDDNEPDIVVLEKSDELTIKPGIFHQFINYSNKTTKVIEIYWTELSSDDIIRRSTGGNSSKNEK